MGKKSGKIAGHRDARSGKNMKTNHLQRLGTIYIAYCWLGILAFIPCMILNIQDVMHLKRGIAMAGQQPIIFMLIGMSSLILLFALLYLAFGRALKAEKPWATQIMGFILGILLLFQFPIGTIIGGYTLWVLAKIDQFKTDRTEVEPIETRPSVVPES